MPLRGGDNVFTAATLQASTLCTTSGSAFAPGHALILAVREPSRHARASNPISAARQRTDDLQPFSPRQSMRLHRASGPQRHRVSLGRGDVCRAGAAARVLSSSAPRFSKGCHRAETRRRSRANHWILATATPSSVCFLQKVTPLSWLSLLRERLKRDESDRLHPGGFHSADSCRQVVSTAVVRC